MKQPQPTAPHDIPGPPCEPTPGWRRPVGSAGGPSPSTATPRSHSISSDMEVQGSSDNLDKLSSCSPTHHLSSSSGLHR